MNTQRVLYRSGHGYQSHSQGPAAKSSIIVVRSWDLNLSTEQYQQSTDKHLQNNSNISQDRKTDVLGHNPYPFAAMPAATLELEP